MKGNPKKQQISPQRDKDIPKIQKTVFDQDKTLLK